MTDEGSDITPEAAFGLVDRAGDEIGRVFDWVARSNWAQAHANVCPVCSGHVREWVRGDAAEGRRGAGPRRHRRAVRRRCCVSR